MNKNKEFKNYYDILASYVSPTILEERKMNVTQMDVFSRLMADRIIYFNTDVNDYSAGVVVAQLMYLDNSDPGSKISIYINSPGGSVYSGYGVIDAMRTIKSPVETVCTGLAASMGSMILMTGDSGLRKAMKHSRIMIHQPLGGISGQASDIEITAKEIRKVKDELYGIIHEATGQPLDRIEKDADRDYWMTAEEAKDYGIIDEIINWTKPSWTKK